MGLLRAFNVHGIKKNIGHFGFHQITCAIKHHESVPRSLQFFELLNGNEGGVHGGHPFCVNVLLRAGPDHFARAAQSKRWHSIR